MARIISSREIPALRSQQPDLAVVDVRLPDDFDAGRLPQAMNQCVFEVRFLDELQRRIPAKDRAVCVYGTGSDSHEARVAAEKLERSGYTHVIEARDGIEGWKSSNLPMESGKVPAATPHLQDGRHPLDLTESTVVWVGRNLINKHWGRVALSGGQVEFRHGRPTAGEATVDLRRITCSDLAGSELHDVLIRHLESDDFFDVARHPSARFTFRTAEVLSDKPGCVNLSLAGELSLRGVTRPLVIEATAGITPEGRAALQCAFAIDRTEWNVIYGSGKFFRRLADHLVNDQIELQLRVVTAS